YMEVIVIFRVIEWAVRTYGSAFDAGNTLYALQQLRPKRVPLLAGLVLRHRQRDFEIHNAMWFKTEGRVLRVPKTFKCESCARQQNNCKRGLHDHQARPHTLSV